MKVLVTGGAGFIGSHVAEHFVHAGAEVVVFDNLRSGYRKNIDGLNLSFVEASILDRDALRDAMQGVDDVFHLAAMISVPESMQDPEGCEELNVTGTRNVLEAAADAGAKKLCFASSAAVYGNNPTIPKVEEMPPEPLSPYASTKLEGEQLCARFTAEGKMPTACLRFFNVFGPRQDPNSAYAAAVPIFIQQAIANEPITIYGDGEQTRDFVYVKDVVAALAFAATHSEVDGVYNIGYGQRTSIRQLAELIIDTAQSDATLNFEPERAGDIKHSLASPARIHTAGFTPSFTLASGLADAFAAIEHA